MEQQKSGATKTIGMVMVLTLLGKAMGLYRDHLLAIHYGMGMEASAFYTASRIPRVFFDAVFASAISACFIPVFSEYLESGGKKKAFAFSRAFLTAIGLLTLLLTGVGMAFSGEFVALFADGYNAETALLAERLTRIMFPFPSWAFCSRWMNSASRPSSAPFPTRSSSSISRRWMRDSVSTAWLPPSW